MPFKSDVSVTQVTDTHWKLLEPVEYEGKRESFRVPKGFVTDFATVPRIFFWLIPSYGAYTKAAILHDYLGSKRIVDPADADGIFRRTMRELKVPFLQRWLMWAAVRLHNGLEGISVADFGRWLSVILPGVVFMTIPAAVVLAWLTVFWFLEVVAYILMQPLSRKHLNPPRYPGWRQR